MLFATAESRIFPFFLASPWQRSSRKTRRDEPLEHLATSDNKFINNASCIVSQGYDPAELVKKFGYSGWYENNPREQYRTIVREMTRSIR